MSRLCTVLITAIAGDVAQGVARIVREVRPSWRLVGADIHSEHAGRLFTDLVETLPHASSDDYIRRLESLVTRNGVDVVIPMSEDELRKLHQLGIGSIGDAALLGMCSRSLEVGLDKLSTADFLSSIGIPGPWTMVAHPGVEPPELPCIFKPRASAGSKGVVICRSLVEAAWQAAQNAHGVFQQLLLPPEREVTCAVYRDRADRTAVLPMMRRLAGGLTSWARVIDELEAVSQCIRIANALDLRGPLNVQMRLTKDGPRIFEINPRFSSTVYLRHLIGFRDVAWTLDEFEGIAPAWVLPCVGAEVVRVVDGAVVSGSGRGVPTVDARMQNSCLHLT